MQPYSPELFNQGDQPGPRMLLDALRGATTPEQLKAQWKAVESAKETKKTQKWPQDMMIPCRPCTDENNGVEVRKPLQAFAIVNKVGDFWMQALAKGQDLMCMRCRQKATQSKQDVIIVCDGCQEALPRKKFGQKHIEIWRQGSSERALCGRCEERKERIARQDQELVYCKVCDRKVPEINFEDSSLAYWRLKDLMHEAECARCKVHLKTLVVEVS